MRAAAVDQIVVIQHSSFIFLDAFHNTFFFTPGLYIITFPLDDEGRRRETKKYIYILYFAAALPSRQRCVSSVTLHNIKVCVLCRKGLHSLLPLLLYKYNGNVFIVFFFISCIE